MSRVVEAIHQLQTACAIECGLNSGSPEVWVDGRVYDHLTHEILQREAIATFDDIRKWAEKRDRWCNGLIEVYGPGGRTIVRRKADT